MRLNVYDTFEDEIAMMNLAKQLQSEGMESMKQPHLWATEQEVPDPFASFTNFILEII